MWLWRGDTLIISLRLDMASLKSLDVVYIHQSHIVLSLLKSILILDMSHATQLACIVVKGGCSVVRGLVVDLGTLSQEAIHLMLGQDWTGNVCGLAAKIVSRR